jgi:streptogramin lyase
VTARRLGGVLVVAALVPAAAAGARQPPGAPTVTGPRTAESRQPVYRFAAARATGFRCAFDTRTLHACAARFSQRLAPGRHVLRVRSVGSGGTRSRVVSVSILVLEPVPALRVGVPVAVRFGAGVPAAAGGSVWVPTTDDGRLARVTGAAVVSRTPVGPASPGGNGFLDSAVAAGGAVWVASDAGGTISRVDAATGKVTARLTVGDRPGGLTEGGDAVWAFHFLQARVTRIDPAAATATSLTVPNAAATGIAYGDGRLWLLTVRPARLLELDPGTGAVKRSLDLVPLFPERRALIQTWWLAAGEGAVWATLPNHEAVVRVDAATGRRTFFRLRHGLPFGVALGDGSAWVTTERAVLRLDGPTGRLLGATALPRANRTGFTSIAYGDGAAWRTDYDRGTLVRVSGP